ncbi:hypothetical protein PFISCL1PPCAC_7484, partial [Pristionchus fissidentatus]
MDRITTGTIMISFILFYLTFQNEMHLYVEMQLLRHSLRDWLTVNTLRRRTDKFKSWFIQIVSAVEYMHEKGHIHRNLKPSNILFDDLNQIKLSDPGIAAKMNADNESDPTTTKKSLYLAPEQHRSRYTSKVDIFSLGLIFAEMSVPMKETEREEIFNNYRQGTPLDILKDQPDTVNDQYLKI